MRGLAKLIIIFTSVFLISCLLEPEQPFTFKKETSLNSNSVEVSGLTMTYPFRVALKDSLLFLMDLHGQENFYHAIKYPDMIYLGSLGRRGNGPKEILLSTPPSLFNDHLIALDGVKRNLLKYPINNFADSNSVEIVSLNDDLGTVVDFVYVDDNHFIVGDLKGKCRFIDIMNGVYTPKFSIPETEKGDNLGMLWRSYMAYSPEFNILAMATQHGDVVELYNLTTGDKKELIGPNGYPKRLNNGSMSEKEGFVDLKWCGGKLYLLYSGRDRAELLKLADEGRKAPVGGNIIFIFDKNGKPVEKYNLDTYIGGFDIDLKNNKIIAANANNDTGIVSFNLK